MKRLLFLILPLLFACSRPGSDEILRSMGSRDSEGYLDFPLSLDDSLVTYSIDIYLYARPKELSAPAGLELLWQLPSGLECNEYGFVGPASKIEVRPSSQLLHCPVRHGFTPSEYGQWTLRLRLPPSFVSEYGVSSAALRLTRNKPSHGTR